MEKIFRDIYDKIKTFVPEDVIDGTEDYFIGVDHGDLPDTACEVKMFVKDGSIYVVDQQTRPIRKDENIPYCVFIESDKVTIEKG
jgi:hypothetical protein